MPLLPGAHRFASTDPNGVVLETLSHGAWLEHSLIIECFHRIPVRWLPDLARDHESLLQPVLGSYATSIHESVGGLNFGFADDVANRMGSIYDHAGEIKNKTLALRCLMTAADRLGRFGPQRKFCTYLSDIKTIDLALPVAEMIAECGRPSVRQFQWFNLEVYHPAIQNALKGLRHQPPPDEDEEVDITDVPNKYDPGDVDNMV